MDEVMVQKISKSEAGKLGSIKSTAIAKAHKAARIAKYDQNPKRCLQCQSPLSYQARKQQFCGHSCRATYHNLARAVDVIWTCKGCGKKHQTKSSKVRQYCSNACQSLTTKADTWSRLQRGEISERSVIRKTLMREIGRHCFECQGTEWRGHEIPLEVDHVDGDAGNNTFSNLRLLCPNCHAITKTWKGRNKGSGRAARGLPLN